MSESVLESLTSHPDYERWENVAQDIIFCLYKEGIPINIMEYIPKKLRKIIDKSDFNPSDIQNIQDGIILYQIRYQYKEDVWRTKTEWYTWQTREGFQKKTVILGECQWVFRPLNIFCRNGEGTLISNMLTYSYRMDVKKSDRNSRKSVRYSAYIQTDLNGKVLKKKYLAGDKEEDIPIRFVFPKKVVSQINRCLTNSFWSEFCSGPCCATWYCTEKGIAHYLGHIQSSAENQKFSYHDLTKLIDGPNGDAALILLAYTCFSVLKPFFPSYPTLRQNSKYLDAKKNIPKQVAINIWSNGENDAEKLVDVCCGCFQKFISSKKNTVVISEGIKIQKTSRELSQLGINEFESKVIQPASVLWIDRRPHIELIQTGKILDICLSPQTGENDITKSLDHSMSEALVNILTDTIHDATKKLAANPNHSGWPIGDEWLNRIDITNRKSKIMQYSLDSVYKKRLAILSKYSRHLRSKYIAVGGSVCPISVSAESQTEIEVDLAESNVRKAAYLSAAFHIFAQVAIPERDHRHMI